MIHRVRVLLLGALLIACGGKPAPPPSCEAMADHVLAMFTPADDLAREIRSVFAERCTQDAWSPEARTCVVATRTVSEPQNCKQKLSPTQQKALDDGVAAAEHRVRGRTIPGVCMRYARALQAVLACDVLPKETREELRQRFEGVQAQWDTIKDKTELEPVCGGGIQALKSAAGACPGSSKW